ncbi:MAG: class B sortase [Lachnospiraceae bacterium]|nr:class B sortase [Lachnospiraceae bacterium]
MKYQRRRLLLKAVLYATLITCLIFIGQACYLSWRHQVQRDELIKMKEVSQEQPFQEEESISENQVIDVADTVSENQVIDAAETVSENQVTDMTEEPIMLEQYVKLYDENPDLAGWITIEGTKIDYPVMQSEDDEYYLHRNFYGTRDGYGCLFVRSRADLDKGTNFIIYGHNMRDGSMFGNLDFYEREGFYEKHKIISFDTLYEERTYEILAVFPSRVYDADEEGFRYYTFYQADTKKEFDDFYENIKELSLYDTGVTAEFGDTFLTLSTCTYYEQDGRLVVVAKRMK